MGSMYPPMREIEVGIFAQPLRVYTGIPSIAVTLRAVPDLRPGVYSLPVTVRYQACTERECLPPGEERLEVAVRVEEG